MPARKTRLIDGQLVFVLLLLAVLCGVAWWLGGPPLVREGLAGGGSLLLRFSAIIAVSFLAAGLAEVLVPQDWVRGSLGRDSGFRGLLIASAAGILTPAGPFVSMPIAAVMIRAGAAIGPVVAFLTGWSVLALHRTIAWEVPILGIRFALLRWGVSLLLPLLAGALASLLASSLARD
jgi:uncharacterized membrane protein YraQ (UPF0718 family)